MKCLSFNCRDLASLDKKLALKRVCPSERIDVIFLQETLGERSLLNFFLLIFLPDWDFHFLDVRGRSSDCPWALIKDPLNYSMPMEVRDFYVLTYLPQS